MNKKDKIIDLLNNTKNNIDLIAQLVGTSPSYVRKIAKSIGF